MGELADSINSFLVWYSKEFLEPEQKGIVCIDCNKRKQTVYKCVNEKNQVESFGSITVKKNQVTNYTGFDLYFNNN